MFEFWEEELSPEREEELLDKAAAAVAKRGMVVPAVAALEMHKPLANVGGHAAVVFAPFLIPFFGFQSVNEYSMLLKSRSGVEKLIQRLESRSTQPQPEKANS